MAAPSLPLARPVHIFIAHFRSSFWAASLTMAGGGVALVLETVGFSAAEGVSLAIIRKIRTLFWVAVRLLLASHYSMPLKENVGKSGIIMTASK